MNSFVFMCIPSLSGGYAYSLVGCVCVTELLTNGKCVGEYMGKCLCRGIYGRDREFK